MNAIALLKLQHEKTKRALTKMSETEDMDPREMRLAADELVAHMVIEEHVFYPRVKELDDEIVTESFEEHAVARFELARVMMATGEDRKIRAKVLKELVEHHIEEEEEELFPKVQKRIASEELERLGTRMEAMFRKACEAGLEKLVVATDQSLRNGGSMANGGAAARPGPTRTKRPTQRTAHAR